MIAAAPVRTVTGKRGLSTNFVEAAADGIGAGTIIVSCYARLFVRLLLSVRCITVCASMRRLQ
jgi:hypothetical protein